MCVAWVCVMCSQQVWSFTEAAVKILGQICEVALCGLYEEDILCFFSILIQYSSPYQRLPDHGGAVSAGGRPVRWSVHERFTGAMVAGRGGWIQ